MAVVTGYRADDSLETSFVRAFTSSTVGRWNDLQNTPRDVQLLADYLLTEYRQRVLTKSRGAAAVS